MATKHDKYGTMYAWMIEAPMSEMFYHVSKVQQLLADVDSMIQRIKERT